MPEIIEVEGIGSVIVVGGCGFFGHHLVSALLDEGSCRSIAVLSRNPRDNRMPGVTYHSVDITDIEAVRAKFEELHPQVVFHTAAPPPFPRSPKDPIYNQVNVVGTQNLLTCATESPTATSFIYTSSASVVAVNPCISVDETAPVHIASSSANLYSKTKALAEAAVLKANNPQAESYCGLRTVVLRPSGMYGERDPTLLTNVLQVLENGKENVQLGENTNLWDYTYAGNAANAHILAAHTLHKGTHDPHAPKVDGEVFFITDGDSLPFWDFIHKVWAAAGWQQSQAKIRVISTRTALVLASIFEWLYWVATLGRLLSSFNKQKVEYCCYTRTFCIDKAKERLEYKAMVSTDEGIRRGVQSILSQKAPQMKK
ncbi:erg26, C-3 sterol dehydrogenase [Agyrium rufum]|nr:erg26, C-3 sterol dehydrogenase [Agyrium rufum]